MNIVSRPDLARLQRSDGDVDGRNGPSIVAGARCFPSEPVRKSVRRPSKIHLFRNVDLGRVMTLLQYSSHLAARLCQPEQRMMLHGHAQIGGTRGSFHLS